MVDRCRDPGLVPGGKSVATIRLLRGLGVRAFDDTITEVDEIMPQLLKRKSEREETVLTLLRLAPCEVVIARAARGGIKR